MAQHSNYWSCTPFADWLRGTKKLSAGTAEEWDDWTTAAQMKHNFRYWLAEEGLSHLQDFVTWPTRQIYSIKYYINNRWITRTHALTAHPRDIKPGTWCDVGNRFLPCLFNELVDFVEVELAWWHLCWEGKEKRKQYNMPWWAVGWWRVRVWRCRQAGLDNLDWQRTLVMDQQSGVQPTDPKFGKPTPQAVKAQEILDLYIWWTDTYRNRPDPHDASGWSAVCEQMRQENGGRLSFGQPKIKALKAASNRAHKRLAQIEAFYEKEDEQMMIRLIKVRHGLWT
jgi:hypothetical protein